MIHTTHVSSECRLDDGADRSRIRFLSSHNDPSRDPDRAARVTVQTPFESERVAMHTHRRARTLSVQRREFSHFLMTPNLVRTSADGCSSHKSGWM